MSINDEVKKIFDSLPPDAKERLMDVFAQSEAEEDFLALAFVGPCPKCGNELTKSDFNDAAEDMDDEGDPTIGICPECDHRWCIECDLPVSEGECPHWEAYIDYCKENDIDEEDIEQYEEWLDLWSESQHGQSERSEPD